MGWSIGYDDNWKRDIGYGVPAYCDHPECSKEIDRGLSYVCGDEPHGGEKGCGLFFCGDHKYFSENDDDPEMCKMCCDEKEPFDPKPDHPDWIKYKLTDKSWQQWRGENSEEVKNLKEKY